MILASRDVKILEHKLFLFGQGSWGKQFSWGKWKWIWTAIKTYLSCISWQVKDVTSNFTLEAFEGYQTGGVKYIQFCNCRVTLVGHRYYMWTVDLDFLGRHPDYQKQRRLFLPFWCSHLPRHFAAGLVSIVYPAICRLSRGWRVSTLKAQVYAMLCGNVFYKTI